MDKNIRGLEDQSEKIGELEYQRQFTPRHEKLWVWQKAHALRLQLHQICRGLPADERFRLRAQLERSSSSVADNIAEGNSGYYYNIKIRSFYTARREAAETQNHIRHLEGKRFMTSREADLLICRYGEIIRGLNGLIKRASQKRDASRLKGSDRL